MHAYPPPSFSPRINLKPLEAGDPDATEIDELEDDLANMTRPLANMLFSQDLLIKTRTLVLSNPPAAWTPDLSRGFVNLRTSVLIHTMPMYFPEEDSIILTNAPSLRHVSLQGTSEGAALPFDQLQTLTIREISLDQAFNLLILCLDLTSYRSYDIKILRREGQHDPIQDTV
jgi:hypothetical protein